MDDPSILLAALFGTTLAPIAGRFGWHWGVVAGFSAHSSAALTVGPVHAGLNLYNNGFAAGIVAAVLVPVITAIQSITRPERGSPAETGDKAAENLLIARGRQYCGSSVGRRSGWR